MATVTKSMFGCWGCREWWRCEYRRFRYHNRRWDRHWLPPRMPGPRTQWSSLHRCASVRPRSPHLPPWLLFKISPTHNTPQAGRRFQGHSRGQCLANLPLLRQLTGILRCISIIESFILFEAHSAQTANLADSASKLAESSTLHRK